MRKSIQDIYNDMYSDDVIEESTLYNINDYTKLISESILEEANEGHGDRAALIGLLKNAYKRGLIDYRETTKGYFVTSKKDRSKAVTVHKGEGSFHPLRRFLKQLGA